MSLQDFFEPFIMQDWYSQSDGFGGIKWGYSDGIEFNAGIITNNSTEMKIAEQQGMKTIYTIITDKAIILEQDDRIKRKRDGAIFRITSNSEDMSTPDVAQVHFSQAAAERVNVE